MVRMNRLATDAVREVKNTFSRFLSILVLSALAVAFLAGLRTTAPDMEYTADNYYDRTRLMDGYVLSTLGLTAEDLDALAAANGIETVEGVRTVDAIAVDAIVTVRSMPERLNLLELTEGRLPEKPDECVTEALLLVQLGLSVGDRLELTLDPDNEGDLARTSFTIVGVAGSPLYVSTDRGTTPLGNGSLDGFVFVPGENFTFDYYTTAYFTAEGLAALDSYGGEYDDRLDALVDSMEGLADRRARLRSDSLIGDAQKELADAQAELDDARADADRELADAQKELSDAREELDSGWADYREGQETYDREIRDAERELSDARKKLRDAEAELAEGRQEYEDGLAEYEEGLAEYEDGRRQYEDALAQFEDAKQSYEEGLAEYEDGLARYEDGLAQYNRGLADYQSGEAQLAAGQAAYQAGVEQLNAAQAGLDGQRVQLEQAWAQYEQGAAQLEAAHAAGLIGDEAYTAALAALAQNKAQLDQSQAQLEEGQARLDEQKAALPGAQAELDAASSQLRDARRQLEESEKQLEESEKQLDEAKAELDEAKAQIDDGQAELDDTAAQLASAKAELEEGQAGLEDARKEIESGEQEIADGWKEYNDGAAELAKARRDGKRELSDALAELENGEKEYADGLAEYEDGRAEADAKIADAQEQLDDARREVEDIGECEWYVLGRSTNSGFEGYAQDAERVSNLANVFPVIFFLVAALACLTTMTRMVEEQRTQIGALKAMGFSRRAISKKYIGYAFFASLLGGVLGLALGCTLIPLVIANAFNIMYDIPALEFKPQLPLYALAVGAAVACTTGAALWACLSTLVATPANLMRPRAPKAGKRVFLEYVRPLWRRLSFTWKVTMRNLFRYQRRFWMTVIGIGGCTALIVTGFGLHDSIFAILDRQFDEISLYDATVGLDGDAGTPELEAVEDYLDGSPYVGGWMVTSQSLAEASAGGLSHSAYLFAVDDLEEFTRFIDLRHRLDDDPVTLPEKGIIITEKLSELLDAEVGDTLTLEKDDRRVEAVVADIVENYVYHYVYLSYGCYEELFREPPEDNAMLVVYQDGVGQEQSDMVSADLMGMDAVASYSYIATIRDSFTDSMEAIDYAVIIIILAAAALAFVVLYNLTNINITERTRELATLKVLGFYDRETTAYVYRENIFLTLFGILLGLVMGRLLHAWMVLTVEVDIVMFGRTAPAYAYALAALLTVVFSVIVNIAAHFRLKKVDMVESLKTVE